MRRSLLLLSLLPALLPAQNIYTNSQSISVSAGTITVTPTAVSPQTAQFEEITTGAPTSMKVTIQGCTAANVCITVDKYSSTGNTDVFRTLVAPRYDHFVIAASWSGGTGVQVTIITTVTGIGNQATTASTFNQSYSDVAELATPANPSTGFERVYGKSGFGLCALDSIGTERCTGSGSGGITGTGTASYLPLWSSSSRLAVSGLSDNGTTLSYPGLFSFGTPNGTTGTLLGFADSTGANTIQFGAPPTAAANLKVYLPTQFAATYPLFPAEGTATSLSGDIQSVPAAWCMSYWNSSAAANWCPVIDTEDNGPGARVLAINMPSQTWAWTIDGSGNVIQQGSLTVGEVSHSGLGSVPAGTFVYCVNCAVTTCDTGSGAWVFGTPGGNVCPF